MKRVVTLVDVMDARKAGKLAMHLDPWMVVMLVTGMAGLTDDGMVDLSADVWAAY